MRLCHLMCGKALTFRTLEIGHFDSPPRLRRGGRRHSQRRGGATGPCGNLAFVLQRLFLDTRRLNDGSRCIRQTTPVPLRGTSPPDLRRGARKTSNLQAQRAAVPLCGSGFWRFATEASLIVTTTHVESDLGSQSGSGFQPLVDSGRMPLSLSTSEQGMPSFPTSATDAFDFWLRWSIR